MRRAVSLLSCAAILSVAAEAHAYRPFDGTDGDVAELGDVELELGPVHWYSQSGRHYVLAPATVLNLGVIPRVELVVDFQNYVGLDTPPGQPRDQLLDTDVLLKGVLIPGVLQEKGTGPSVALEAGPLLPNVNGEESFGASADLIVSQRWSGFTAHLNNWFELTRGELHADWIETLILEGSAEPPIRPVSELLYEHEFVANVSTYSVLVGAIWRAAHDLDLDMGFRVARVGDDPAAEIRLGLTWTLGLWGGKKDDARSLSGRQRFAFAR